MKKLILLLSIVISIKCYSQPYPTSSAIKAYFCTGCVPTSENFEDFVDAAYNDTNFLVTQNDLDSIFYGLGILENQDTAYNPYSSRLDGVYYRSGDAPVNKTDYIKYNGPHYAYSYRSYDTINGFTVNNTNDGRTFSTHHTGLLAVFDEANRLIFDYKRDSLNIFMNTEDTVPDDKHYMFLKNSTDTLMELFGNGDLKIHGEISFDYPHAVGGNGDITYNVGGTEDVYYRVETGSILWPHEEYITTTSDSVLPNIGHYNVYAYVNATTTNANDLIYLKLYKASVPDGYIDFPFSVQSKGSGVFQTLACMWYVDINTTSDWLSFYVSNQTANRAVNIHGIKVIIEKIQER